MRWQEVLGIVIIVGLVALALWVGWQQLNYVER